MNVLAAGHGWRDLAIWAMPPIAYALASDTAIGVVRAWTIARQRALNEALAGDGTSPLAIVGGLLLWVLRLVLAPVSTLSGFRRWVLEECPVAPGRRAARHCARAWRGADARGLTQADRRPPGSRGSRACGRGPRTRRSVSWRWWPSATARCADFPLTNVSRRSAPSLRPRSTSTLGAARTALRRHVQAAQNGSSS